MTYWTVDNVQLERFQPSIVPDRLHGFLPFKVFFSVLCPCSNAQKPSWNGQKRYEMVKNVHGTYANE